MRRINKIIAVLVIGLSLPASADHAPASYYTAEQVVKDLHYIYQEQRDPKISLEDYKDDVFCKDPERLSYLIWLINTKLVKEDVKRAIFNSLLEAEDIYCMELS